MQIANLSHSPLIAKEFEEFDLHPIDKMGFEHEQGIENEDLDQFSDVCSSHASTMLGRFDDTKVLSEDVILTARLSN